VIAVQRAVSWEWQAVHVKLLLVDDDVALTTALQHGLRAEGFTVDVCDNGVDALWQVTEGHYDLIVLDVLLPQRNGFLVCADLRRRDNWTPVLMLTAKQGEFDQTEALENGADDFISKPFSFAVLVARIRAILRRASGRSPAPVAVGDLRIDPARRLVWRGDQQITLTSRQFQVLEFLVRHEGQVVSKQEMLDGVWSHDFEGDPNIVEVYLRRLRSSIDEPFGRHSLVTTRGAGYRIVDDRETK